MQAMPTSSGNPCRILGPGTVDLIFLRLLPLNLAEHPLAAASWTVLQLESMSQI